jgi:hypothetical protein
LGASALFNNTTGTDNVGIGFVALQNNTGSGNVALGSLAGAALASGNSNICIGNNVIGVAGESNTLRIGQSVFTTFIAGIRGVTTGNNNAVNVVIDSDGQLGTLSSSRRFKKEIKPMDKASEAILALKPVTFHYKGDETNRPEFGLIAEDVAEINPDLVVRDDNGKVYTVRYDAVNAMLLNEFLKEHRKVEEQQATIARLKQDFQFEFAEQEKKIETLTKGLERVSAQLEADRSSPQVVAKSP